MSAGAIIDRIKKLLRLAGNNSSAEESAAAAAKAQELMLRYKIDAATIDLNAGEAQPAEEVRSHWDNEPVDTMKRYSTWKARLLSVLCKANACDLIVIPGGNRFSTQYRVIGTATNASLVRWLYQFIVPQIEGAATKYAGLGRTYINNFKLGAVQGVREKLAEMQTRVQEQTKHDAVTALMVIGRDHEQLQKYMAESKHKFTKMGGWRTNSNQDARERGRQAGRNVNVNRGLIGGE